ncbi:Mur ligase family protein [Alphaproteobacteria bacterium]|nr:Mur ligase family protein [Alphaproteobacteria bacterium]
MSDVKSNQMADSTRAAIALNRLAALHPKLIDLGLDRTFDLLARLGNPHDNLPPTIHVSGTNGKGSTIALMRAMAEHAGLTVHVYSSPHLCRFNERIRLAGNLISDRELADLLEEVETRNDGQPVTFFEVTTAAAMLAFSRVPADLLLLETGLGGELDSTNVLSHPTATIITPIARDHEHFLGSDITGIAAAKAGIMRAGVPCFSAAQDPIAAAELARHAAAIGTSICIAGTDFTLKAANPTNENAGVLDLGDQQIDLPPIALRGRHQIDNAALAMAALHHVIADIRSDINASTLAAGLANATWPGRVQRLTHGRLVDLNQGQDIWLDGAHNAHGAAALSIALDDINADRWVVICGALNTRDPAEFLAPIGARAHSFHCLTIPDQEASLTGETMAKAAVDLGLKSTAHADIEAAIAHINNDAAFATLPVVICGSLYLAGHILLANETPPQ